MNRPQELPDDLVWEGEHLSEVVLTALADGQDALVPERARVHAARCVACTHAIGAAALLSSHVGEALAAARLATEKSAAPDTAPLRKPLPLAALGVAVTLACIGAIPMLGDVPLRAAELSTFFVRTLPQVIRGALAVLRATRDIAPFVSVVASLVLVLAGLAVARAMPRAAAA